MSERERESVCACVRLGERCTSGVMTIRILAFMKLVGCHRMD